MPAYMLCEFLTRLTTLFTENIANNRLSTAFAFLPVYAVLIRAIVTAILHMVKRMFDLKSLTTTFALLIVSLMRTSV